MHIGPKIHYMVWALFQKEAFLKGVNIKLKVNKLRLADYTVIKCPK